MAVSGQRSAVRKIDHKLTVYGTEDNCLNVIYGILGIGIVELSESRIIRITRITRIIGWETMKGFP